MGLYNTLLNSVILPIGDCITGGNYLKNLKLWEDYDRKTEAEHREIQHKQLIEILDYAIKHVPYYKKYAKSNNLTPTGIDLNQFPILTKDILRSEIDSLISDEFQKSKLDINYSSGSTGVQSFTYMTKAHKYYLRALQTHWWCWSGYQPGDSVLQFGISQKRGPLKSIKDFFYRVSYHKAFGISSEEFELLANRLKSNSIRYIAGYPSVINQLALASEQNEDIKGVICFGDKLFSNHEVNIYNSFGSKVKLIDTYGCAEGLLMACRKDLEYYYIMSPHVLIEIVDEEGKPVESGVMGSILVTCLTNRAMPLIRYKLGDLGIMLPKELYPEERQFNYPLLQKIVGRETDVIKTKSGKILNVHSFTGVFEYFHEIKQFKIIQRDLNSIKVEYIIDGKLEDKRLRDLENKFLELTKSELVITFVELKHITATKSGKPQIIDTTLVQ